MFRLFTLGFTSIFLLMTSSCSLMNEGDNYTSDPHEVHHHHHSAHLGVVEAFFQDGLRMGFLELKLHDDKGDLELWLSHDDLGINAYPIPLDSKITVHFTELQKNVVLEVRNKQQNEDEDGRANIVNNKTNYFIFPGDTGADASWLMGKSFASPAIVTFTLNGQKYKSKAFTLSPHTH